MAKHGELPPLITVGAHDKVRQAVERLQEADISQAPVVREDSTDVSQFVGSIRDRELLDRIFRDPDALQADVAEVMAPPIPMVEFDDPIESAFGELEHGPAVLVTKAGQVLGVLTQERPARLPGPPATDTLNRAVRSLGIDVGVAKGLDLVLMDERRVPLAVRSHTRPAEVGALIEELRPDVVAIDSPPRWAASGRSRRTERELAACNIQSFNTPSEAAGTRQHVLRVDGGRVRGVPRRRTSAASRRTAAARRRRRAMEVFPHATAVVLAGSLPPKETSETSLARTRPARPGRSDRRADIDRPHRRGARGADRAARARGETVRAGRPAGGRDHASGEHAPGQAVPTSRANAPNVVAPLFNYCACGDPACDALVRGEFAPGHDAKRKAMLWRRAREGQGSIEELEERGWKLPPEMR